MGRRNSALLELVRLIFLLLVTCVWNRNVSRAQLLVDYYADSCPRAENIVTDVVQRARFDDPLIYAKLLRLFFHDCFVGGCDASILLDSTPTNTAEKDDPGNLTVDGYDLIDDIKSALEDECDETVSCADIIALAARDAVFLSGGPDLDMPTGRRDGLVSLAASVRANIPDSANNLDQLLSLFSSKGLSINDLVILTGGHSIGVAHCNAVRNRFIFANGTVTLADPSMDPDFARSIVTSCPENPLPTTTVTLDTVSDRFFDAQYYNNLQDGRGLMTSDQVLFTDTRSQSLVNSFADNQRLFYDNWRVSFVNLGNIGVITDPNGEIRSDCRALND